MNLFLHLFRKLGLATLIAVALMLPLAGLTYADDPLVVNSTGDDGDFAPGDGTCETGNGNGICTLRAAIQESNTNTTITHTISFSITGAGPHTISPGFALPDITHPVTIDGLTEPGASCTSWPPTLLIEIDGTNVPAVINSISPPVVTPPIGLSVISGTSTIRGLVINNFKKSVIVVGNIGTGVAVNNSDNNVIECNFLGTETNGITAAANQFGIALGNADNNLVTNNLISGNGDGSGGSQDAGISIGIEFDSAGNSKNNQIIGNYIGTVVTGTTARPNGEDGILLINAQNTVVSGNLISGNGDDGVDITDVDSLTISIYTFSLACDAPPCATGNIIQNNTIGLDINGNALGNGNSGIEIKNAEQNRVYSNTIANNAYQGVEINELTDADKACTKGTTPCTLSNTVTANSIFANTELGIDLTANSTGGVTPNDSGPNGANRLQNYPVLSAALTSTTSLYVSGSLTSSADSNFTVELFANDSCDASGHGEGQTFLISDTLTTNGSGVADFFIKSSLPSGQHIVATATDSGGNTSEFSECAAVSGALNTLYVDTDATGAATGLSWTDAFTNPQNALAIASSGQEIWVATGVYTPGATVSDTFSLPPGVALYGGFAATETLRSQRNVTANLTILSGDIDGDDTNTAGVVITTTDIVGSNAYHVLYLDGVSGPVITESTVVDGFTITAGQANGSVPNDSGGGLYCAGNGSDKQCSPSLTNASFSGNSVSNRGGAMLNNGSDSGSSSPSLTNVIFNGNSANEGGAMFNDGLGGNCSPSLTNVTFSSNSALDGGGAMFNNGYFNYIGSNSPNLTNVTFTGNSASYGGAMFNEGTIGSSSPSLSNVILWNNTVTISGSQMYNNSASPVITTSLVQGGWNGSGVFNQNATVTDGGGNLNANPLFADTDGADNIAGTPDDDLRLLPGSAAIDSGTNSGAPNEDIRGETRPVNGVVDMGAYEMQGFALAISGGNNQSAPINTTFGQPLSITVSSSFGEPVGPGGVISFTAPASGASVTTQTLTATTNSSGIAGVTVTANGITGTYTLTATTNGVIGTKTFSLTNTPLLPGPDLAITKTVTLSGAEATPGDPITYTITVANSGGTDATNGGNDIT